MSSRPSGWLPDSLDELQAVGMASQWLCSFSRPSRWLPDGLELIQVIGKPSQRPGAHPGYREAIPTAWSSSRLSGSHPDGLESHPDGLESHPDGLESHPDGLESHPDGLEMLQSHPDGLEMLQSHPDGLELIQAIGIASRWLWSFSRPSGWLPDGSGAHPGHRNCIPTAWKQIFELVRIFKPKNGGSILRIESNRIQILESI
ncbi:hypothetical protein KEM48_002051 [Puccinia striiformis f. sp. tritici PST-130]|nr:hypothetical protein KEM48_002051 [Puccinia striiformis f. sp. tritici PST-130]